MGHSLYLGRGEAERERERGERRESTRVELTSQLVEKETRLLIDKCRFQFLIGWIGPSVSFSFGLNLLNA